MKVILLFVFVFYSTSLFADDGIYRLEPDRIAREFESGHVVARIPAQKIEKLDIDKYVVGEYSHKSYPYALRIIIVGDTPTGNALVIGNDVHEIGLKTQSNMGIEVTTFSIPFKSREAATHAMESLKKIYPLKKNSLLK
jgi:hypothetical protein